MSCISSVVKDERLMHAEDDNLTTCILISHSLTARMHLSKLLTTNNSLKVLPILYKQQSTRLVRTNIEIINNAGDFFGPSIVLFFICS